MLIYVICSSGVELFVGVRCLTWLLAPRCTPTKRSAPICTVTKTILYHVDVANKVEWGPFWFECRLDVTDSEGRWAEWRHIDWVFIRRNKKREVVVVGVEVCERWKQLGLGYSTLLLEMQRLLPPYVVVRLFH